MPCASILIRARFRPLAGSGKPAGAMSGETQGGRGTMEWAIPGAIVALLCIFAGIHVRGRRKSELAARYGDAAAVRAIMAGDIRHGMNEEMIIDALGHPEKIDTLVTASGTIRILRYGLSGQSRFSGRIRLEDGVVVGWMRE